MTREEKRQAITAALKAHPNLSNRAIAQMTGTSLGMVSKVRVLIGKGADPRFEASGRRARGQPPRLDYYVEHLPDGHGILYRCYNSEEQLIYVSTSFSFIRRLATQHLHPWFTEIAEIVFVHFPDADSALEAERIAIRNEQPKYNIQSKLHERSDAQQTRITKQQPPKPPTPPKPPAKPLNTPTLSTATPGMIRRPTGRVQV